MQPLIKVQRETIAAYRWTLYTHDGPECISSYPYTVYSRATVYTETRMGYFIVGAGHVINAIIDYNGTIIFN